MTQTAENTYTDLELKEIFIQKGIKEEEYQFFLKHYQIAYNDFSSDQYETVEEKEENEGKPFREIVLNFVLNHCLIPFNKLIERGHSKEWSFMYVEKNYSSEDLRDFLSIYEYFLDKDKEFALKELKIFCNNYNNDVNFLDYLLKQFEEFGKDERLFPKADIYCKVYKEQIEQGKSELYADKYADYSANENSSIECFIFAETIEQLISKGESENYAVDFAWAYLEEIGNDLYLYSEDSSITGCFKEIYYGDVSDPEGMKNCYYQTAKAKVYANVYTFKNRIENCEKFVDIYKDNYFNIHSKHKREKVEISEEELYGIALKETLDEFKKLGYK